METLKISQELLNIIYPVGSVYLTINDVDPKTLFGGTWVKCSGGGKGHSHTLNNHTHDIPYFACYIWKRTA